MENKIFVTKPFLPPLQEYVQEISSLWESHILTNMGEKHKTFERLLSEYLDIPNVVLFSNGHMALELALNCLETKGEIITTPFSFVSTASAIVRAGHTPVFCDILEDCTIDPYQIERFITPKTVAILPVHVYGNICDHKKIEEIAQRYHLKVIYDAAHAFGVKKNNQSVASFGDMSMFSFHSTKVFHSIEGGCICCKDNEIAEKLRLLRNFGICGPENTLYIAPNAKMNEFQAAMGLCNLRHINEFIFSRQKIFEKYVDLLKDTPGIRFLSFNKSLDRNFAYLPIFIDEMQYGHTRDELCAHLAQHSIYARKYFFPLISEFECFRSFFSSTPRAHRISRQVLTLPIYVGLEEANIMSICDIINSYQRSI